MAIEHPSATKAPHPPGLMIVGTDTGVGKTFVTCLIARACRARGVRVGVYKPVASGCRADTIEDSDGWQLWNAAGRPQTLEAVCPQSFVAPLAPHLAARHEGRVVDEELLLEGLQAWQSVDLLLIEGVGGLMTPLSDELYVADLAYSTGYRLLLVAPNRLGVINQTLQTLITATTFREGLDVAGIVLNDVAPDESDVSRTSNAEELQQRCVPPLLTHVRWQSHQLPPSIDWLAMALRQAGHEPDDDEESPN